MTDPPRKTQTTTRLPPAIELREKPVRTISEAQRRANVGILAYSLTKSSQSLVGTGKKQFEVGQVLNFDTVESVAEIEPMLVADATEIRHDTNILDLESLGLSSDDISAIESGASTIAKELGNQLNSYRKTRADLEVKISENKKVQNENRKAREAIQRLVSFDGSYQQMLDKLTAKAAELVAEEVQLIAAANEAATKATATVDALREVSQVVR